MDDTGAACTPEAVAMACSYRHAAVKAGRFHFDYAKGGWYWKDATSPYRPWTDCPWCGGALPTPRAMRGRETDVVLEHILDPIRQADGFDFDPIGLEEGEG
jgi:hypothetical protein